jgi:hypothetical protein
VESASFDTAFRQFDFPRLALPGVGLALGWAWPHKLGRWSTLYTHTLLSGLQFKRAEEIATSYFLLAGFALQDCLLLPSLSPLFLLAQILMRTDLGDEPDVPTDLTNGSIRILHNARHTAPCPGAAARSAAGEVRARALTSALQRCAARHRTRRASEGEVATLEAVFEGALRAGGGMGTG